MRTVPGFAVTAAVTAGWVVLVGAILAGAATRASADVVHLKGGRTLVGKVEESGDSVKVTMDGGAVTIPRSKVESIERGEVPRDGFERRVEALAAGDVAGALALAAEAETAGCADAAGRALERAAVWAPADPAVRAASQRWRIFSRRLPGDPEADAKLLSACGEGARLLLTDHFRIAYVAAPDEVRRRGESLEAAYRKVHELSAKLGIDAHPIDRRMDVLLFADHETWVRALGKPAEELQGMSGIYIHESARVYLFDTATLPEAARARAEAVKARAAIAAYETSLAAQKAQVEKTAADVAEAVRRSDAARRRIAEDALTSARASLRAAQDKADAERARIDAFEQDIADHLERENLGTTTHEACHQLTFATGVCRPGQPIWLLEGLATLFEVTSRTTFVPESVNEMRLADLRRVWDAGRISRLADVVSDAVFTTPGGDRLAAYAEAWSVSHFLSRRHPAAFAKYVREARLLANVAASAPQRLADFRAAFGDDLDALDRAWKDDVRLLRR